MRIRSIAGSAVLVVAGACSASSSAAQPQATTPSMPDHGMSMSPGGMMPSPASPGPAGFAFGTPGDPTESTRVVKISLLDTLRFAPAVVRVREGETVTFEIKNDGKIDHEFILGDSAYQRQHEMAMAGMAGSIPPDEPNSVTVQPGFIKTVVWTFTSPGNVVFGCHQPGHFAGGMKGVVVVGPKA